MHRTRTTAATAATAATAMLLIICSLPVAAQNQPRRAIVVDERLSALREHPHVEAKVRQRLRRGRVVWVIETRRSREGHSFSRVAVTRRTSGWIATLALVSRGRSSDGRRLIELIEQTPDDFVRIRLARICADEFRGTEWAPKALMLLAQAAERSAERVTLASRKRVGGNDDFLIANDVSIDRFSRAGIRFKAIDGRLVYDGAAWREIARLYPKSAEAYFLPPYSSTR